MAKKKKDKVIKLDIGCGPNPKEGFDGVDCIKFPAVKHVVKLGSRPLPFAAGSVDEIHSSHFLEHLTQEERCFFMNDVYRVLKPTGSMALVVPHWASGRAYGDPTHKWPAISEMFFYYLDKGWREANAPHTDRRHWEWGYECDFEFTFGYTLHQSFQMKNEETKNFAVSFYKEACQDILATLKPRKK
jgi:ubiquinone/menaquinone biosynthesis C-methylase UbiE